MKYCSTKSYLQCIMWEKVIFATLMFIATYTIVSRVFELSLVKEVVISVCASLSIVWCMWVVYTFRSIVSWWIDMQSRMTEATALLQSTKTDLAEIKKLAKS
jgi:cellulose synthase/poly-beta-1,6-N-acetylglucosamine synthase-like glycosyltransferase